MFNFWGIFFKGLDVGEGAPWYILMAGIRRLLDIGVLSQQIVKCLSQMK